MQDGGDLLMETIAPRTELPPLLAKLSERPPEPVDYLGVAYGITPQLYRYCVYYNTRVLCTVYMHNFFIAGSGSVLVTSPSTFDKLLLVYMHTYVHVHVCV